MSDREAGTNGESADVDPGLHQALVTRIAGHICARDESDDPVDWGSTDSVAFAAADAVGPFYEEIRAASIEQAEEIGRLRRFVEQCADPSPHWRFSEIRAAARAALSGRGTDG